MSSKRSPLKTHKDFIYALLWIIETFMNKYQTTRHKLYLELRLIPFWKVRRRVCDKNHGSAAVRKRALCDKLHRKPTCLMTAPFVSDVRVCSTAQFCTGRKMLVGAFGLSLKVELTTRDTNYLLKVKNRISFFSLFWRSTSQD